MGLAMEISYFFSGAGSLGGVFLPVSDAGASLAFGRCLGN